MRPFPFLLALLCAFPASAQDLRVATLNCEWYFQPSQKSGQVKADRVTTTDEYNRKTANLAKIIADTHSEFVGLQELGGVEPLRDLANVTGKAFSVPVQTAFKEGKDTYTGQNVGAFLLEQPKRWTIQSSGRVRELDSLVSKHLVVRLRHASGKEIEVLVVHLIRPMGSSAAKHGKQVDAICRWMAARSADPNRAAIVLGDTNDNEKPPRPFAVAGWTDAFLGTSIHTTHTDGHGLYDRIVASPQLKISAVEVGKSPMPRKANEATKRIYTDHLSVSAEVGWR